MADEMVSALLFGRSPNLRALKTLELLKTDHRDKTQRVPCLFNNFLDVCGINKKLIGMGLEKKGG
jgi:hypothetical protein